MIWYDMSLWRSGYSLCIVRWVLEPRARCAELNCRSAHHNPLGMRWTNYCDATTKYNNVLYNWVCGAAKKYRKVIYGSRALPGDLVSQHFDRPRLVRRRASQFSMDIFPYFLHRVMPILRVPGKPISYGDFPLFFAPSYDAKSRYEFPRSPPLGTCAPTKDSFHRLVVPNGL